MWIRNVSVYFYFCLYIFCDCRVNCATLNDTKTLTSDLLSDYNINVRPVADQSMAVNVSVQTFIKSIQEFDEVQGKFSFVGALLIKWHDVSMTWNPALYGGVNEVTVLYPNVWIPEMVLLSPSEDVDSLGQKWNKIRYFYNGMAVWYPIDLIESTCSVNVRNYPFDTQKCVTTFSCLGYLTYEVQLLAASNEFSLEFYQENSLWTIEKTRVSVPEEARGSQIDLVLYLNRKPSFVIINVIMPILFLSLLNVLVFLLIPESGEIVSYCITVLLAVAVFMTIVSDMLPRSSEPVSVISFKPMADMIISSLIALVTIVNLKWYYRDDSVPIPLWLKWLYRSFSCVCCGRNKVDPRVAELQSQDNDLRSKVKTINVVEIGKVPIEEKIKPVVSEKIEETPVTWKQISVMVDWMALVGFTSASLANFVIFIATTSMSSD